MNSSTSSQSAAAKGVYSHPQIQGLKYGSLGALMKAGRAVWLPLGALLYMWVAVNIVFFGIQLGVKDFKGNMLVNTSVSATADMVGYTLAGFGANILGRKVSLFLGYTLAAAACLVYSFLKTHLWAVYLSVSLGKLGISFCFNVMYIVTAETFPTEYRGTIFGASNFFARGGGFIAPFVEGLLSGSFMLIFAVLSATAALAVLCLRETRHLRMPDSLDEYFKPTRTDSRPSSLHAVGLPEGE